LGEGILKIPNVKVVERTMGVDLITEDGRVVGAYALNTRTGEVTAFLAKATVLTAGIAARQFIETPESLFMTWHCPNNVGDAQAMAYRAGAELINAEFGFLDYSSCREGGGVFGLHPFDKMPLLKNRLGERIIKTREDNDVRVFLMVKESPKGVAPCTSTAARCPRTSSGYWSVTSTTSIPSRVSGSGRGDSTSGGTLYRSSWSPLDYISPSSPTRTGSQLCLGSSRAGTQWPARAV
jgi:hypothetical protein